MSKAITYIDQLADSLSKFPGIGRKGAERIAVSYTHLRAHETPEHSV